MSTAIPESPSNNSRITDYLQLLHKTETENQSLRNQLKGVNQELSISQIRISDLEVLLKDAEEREYESRLERADLKMQLDGIREAALGVIEKGEKSDKGETERSVRGDITPRDEDRKHEG